MISLTSQQRLQYRLGVDLNDYIELDIELETPRAAVVADRLNRAVLTLPLCRARLERASKYSLLPIIRAIPLEEIQTAAPATIAVECRQANGLTIRFTPLLWDVFSILRLLEASLEEHSPSVEVPRRQLFEEEGSARSSGTAPPGDKLAVASPKTYREKDGVHRGLACVPLAGSKTENGTDRVWAVAERAFREGELIGELPIGKGLGAMVGNLSYFVPMSSGREIGSPRDLLTAHHVLAQQPEAVALGIGVVVLPHVPGVASVAYRGTSRGMAEHIALYQSPTQLVVSATYAATAFSERECRNHFRDLTGALGEGRAERPRIEERDASPEHGSISEMLLGALSRRPDRAAVRTPERDYSRRELLIQARKIADQIPGQPARVGIYGRNSFEFVASVAACVLRGTCYVPLDRHSGSARLRDIIEAASLDVVLCAAGDEAEVDALGARPLVVGEELKVIAEPLSARKASGPIYRIHTSGTTGKPKPVDVSDSNLRALFSSYSDISNEIYTMTWGFTSSIGFDASVKQYLGPLLYGGVVFIPSAALTEDTVGVLRQLSANDVDVLNLTPQLLRVAVDADLCHFRFVLVSGDTLPPRLVEDFHDRTPATMQLVNLYGPTEATINAMAYRVSRKIRYHSLPIGHALGTCRVEVHDAVGEQQPYCARGSLKIFGDIVTSGHLHAGADRFGRRDGVPYFDSGDECFVWYDDLAYFLGRNDRQIKINGIRVNLDEVASWLRDYVGVATCYVGAIGSRIYAVLVRQELAGKADSIAALADPSRFGRLPLWPIVVDAIPVDVNGKVRLADLLEEQRERSIRPVEPAQDLLELEVHAVVQTGLGRRGLESLGAVHLGVSDNLFEHGLDSLLAMQFALELSARFNVDLSPGEVATNPTCREVAGLLRTRGVWTELIQLTGLRERERLIILLPPVLGSSLVFSKVAEQLSADHFVAACTYPSVDEGTGSIEGIACAIVDELRRRDLLGHRIDVVGYSMGGSVGFELCKQLEGAARISGLYVLDKPVRPRGGLLALQQAGARLLDSFIAGKPISEKLGALLRRSMRSNIDTVYKYAPRGNVSVPTHLFVCVREDDPVSLAEWSPYLSGEQTVTELECGHGDVLAAPHIDAVLASLAANHLSMARSRASAVVE
ncbi:AMP-binding protein [Bradyrhizobium japonicum]|nr:AMP-binding protein [Bradyrhizobium japonicum]